MTAVNYSYVKNILNQLKFRFYNMYAATTYGAHSILRVSKVKRKFILETVYHCIRTTNKFLSIPHAALTWSDSTDFSKWMEGVVRPPVPLVDRVLLVRLVVCYRLVAMVKWTIRNRTMNCLVNFHCKSKGKPLFNSRDVSGTRTIFCKSVAACVRKFPAVSIMSRCMCWHGSLVDTTNTAHVIPPAAQRCRFQ